MPIQQSVLQPFGGQPGLQPGVAVALGDAAFVEAIIVGLGQQGDFISPGAARLGTKVKLRFSRTSRWNSSAESLSVTSMARVAFDRRGTLSRWLRIERSGNSMPARLSYCWMGSVS